MRPAQKRLEFLDSVRGLAALAVLLSHVLGAFNWADQFLLRALLNPFSGILVEGTAAVALFFVLNRPSFDVKRVIRILATVVCGFLPEYSGKTIPIKSLRHPTSSFGLADQPVDPSINRTRFLAPMHLQ